jgi:hypothetical protein
VNTASLLRNYLVFSPGRHASVFLIPETATLVCTHIAVISMHKNNSDTDRFPKRLAHQFSSTMFVFPSLIHDGILLFIHRQGITETIHSVVWFLPNVFRHYINSGRYNQN